MKNIKLHKTEDAVVVDYEVDSTSVDCQVNEQIFKRRIYMLFEEHDNVLYFKCTPEFVDDLIEMINSANL